MGADIQAFIQIDDNTPSDQPPFTNDPSTWDLRGDIGLVGCKDHAFFAAISGVRNEYGIAPLFARRNLPDTKNKHDPIFSLLDDIDDTYVSWLTLSEIRDAIANLEVKHDDLSKHVVRVMECMATLERLNGTNRVRLVFGIHD